MQISDLIRGFYLEVARWTVLSSQQKGLHRVMKYKEHNWHVNSNNFFMPDRIKNVYAIEVSNVSISPLLVSTGSVAENTARSTVTNVDARETSTQENRATSNVNFKDRLPKINNSDRETHAGNANKGTANDTESREINTQDKGAVTNVTNKNLMPLTDNRETHEATDAVVEKHSEIPQKEGAIGERHSEEADKLSNDQSNSKSNAKKKPKKKEKASKETGNTGTNTGVNEEMREGSEGTIALLLN